MKDHIILKECDKYYFSLNLLYDRARTRDLPHVSNGATECGKQQRPQQYTEIRTRAGDTNITDSQSKGLVGISFSGIQK